MFLLWNMELMSGCKSDYRMRCDPFRVGVYLECVPGTALRALPRGYCMSRLREEWAEAVILNDSMRRGRTEEGSSRSHVGFVDVKVGVDLLHVVVIFDGFHQAQHCLRAATFQFDVGLRDH